MSSEDIYNEIQERLKNLAELLKENQQCSEDLKKQKEKLAFINQTLKNIESSATKISSDSQSLNTTGGKKKKRKNTKSKKKKLKVKKVNKKK